MVQGYFDLLVEVLDHAKMEGNAMPKQKYIKQQLLKKNPFIFERSGLKSFEGNIIYKIKYLNNQLLIFFFFLIFFT